MEAEGPASVVRFPILADLRIVALTVTSRTMAQAFSSALDSAFMLDSDVNNLSQTIDQK